MNIEEMYAYVAVDPEDGYEGVCSFYSPAFGGWMPMFGADMERVNLLREQVQALANQAGTAIRLLRFSVREEIEVIEPEVRK